MVAAAVAGRVALAAAPVEERDNVPSNEPARTECVARFVALDIDQLAAAKGKFIFDESNHERTSEGFRVRVRPWDYRLIELRPAGPSP